MRLDRFIVIAAQVASVTLGVVAILHSNSAPHSQQQAAIQVALADARSRAPSGAEVVADQVSVVSPYALVIVIQGQTAPYYVLKLSGSVWRILGKSGGDIPPAVLTSDYGIPPATAVALYNGLQPAPTPAPSPIPTKCGGCSRNSPTRPPG